MKPKLNLAPATLRLALCLLLLATLYPLSAAFAQGTAFTYQGRLNDGSSPASGTYDLRFTLYDSPANGTPAGGPVTNAPVSVSNGLFTVTLDFGASAFSGADRWLEMDVRINGTTDAYETLSPRQRVTSTPYAIRAANFGGAVSDAQLSPNVARLNMDQTFSGTVNFNGGSNNFTGSFTGNGAGVTNLDLEANSQGAIFFSGNTLATFSKGLTLFSASFSSPRSVALADFNADGRLDFAVVSSLNSTLSVFTNNGIGSFLSFASLSVGSSPQSVAAADVNGDGRIDLVSANFSGNTLTVVTNRGTGFAFATTLSAGAGPQSVKAVDVNGDGRVDLISANRTGDTLTVLTNNGTGGFVIASSPLVGDQPIAIAVADVNLDGRIDLVSANFGTNTLTVLTN